MRIIIGSLVILNGLNVYSNQSGSFAFAARVAVASAGGCTIFQEEVNYSKVVHVSIHICIFGNNGSRPERQN